MKPADGSMEWFTKHSSTLASPLVQRLDAGRFQCLACAHRCVLSEGAVGICNVRFVLDGRFHYPFGYVSSLACDPIEKKPLYHVLPGADVLSFGMLGCNLRCDFCQNWDISQVGRDSSAVAMPVEVTAKAMVDWGVGQGAKAAASTYNEPLITAEWAVEVFTHAKRVGMRTGMVSNGNATEQVLDFLRPHIDFFKIDLKAFRADSYRQLGGSLANVLSALRYAVQIGLWVEVVTLIIPDFNDSPDEIRQAARFLIGVSEDIPWHLTAFHPDYRRTGVQRTSAETIARLCEVAQEEGVRFVYAGNTSGMTRDWDDTRCPACRTPLIQRAGFQIRNIRLDHGRCPQCGTEIPGIWA